MNNKISEFIGIDEECKKKFIPYRLCNTFADTTFSMLYSWNEEFDYHIKEYDGAIAVIDTNKSGKISCMVIMKNDFKYLEKLICDLYEISKNNKQGLVIEYVSENDIEKYISAAKGMGLNIDISTDEIYDDYVYKTEDYINMSGNSNKRKRGGYNYFIRNYSDLKCLDYTEDMYCDVMKIFDEWCKCHECRNCFYGCEKIGLERFIKIYDENTAHINVLYSKETPLSFIVCEKINDDTISCYFQKNAVRIRGLTYYLSRETALKSRNIKYINLGEDMGIAGLREDKSSLHPAFMLKKYTLIIDNKKPVG